ncbi:MAG: oxygen-binding di-iron domain-containing protein [Planctomycetota bacterium]|jgi:flavorubredoxin
MSKNLHAIQIADKVYWVGAIDWGVRNIHGYNTDRGTTYNAYLVMDDKIALFDTVKKGFEDELLSRISSLINPKKIDYIISNHSEPDHSEVLPEIIKAVKPEKVFASAMGEKTLNSYYHDLNMEITAVKDGEELSLGSKTVKFIETTGQTACSATLSKTKYYLHRMHLECTLLHLKDSGKSSHGAS